MHEYSYYECFVYFLIQLEVLCQKTHGYFLFLLFIKLLIPTGGILLPNFHILNLTNVLSVFFSTLFEIMCSSCSAYLPPPLPQSTPWPFSPHPHSYVAFSLDLGESLGYHFPPGRKGTEVILLHVLNTYVRTIMLEWSALAVRDNGLCFTKPSFLKTSLAVF